jgi:hypothetical protein
MSHIAGLFGGAHVNWLTAAWLSRTRCVPTSLISMGGKSWLRREQRFRFRTAPFAQELGALSRNPNKSPEGLPIQPSTVASPNQALSGHPMLLMSHTRSTR